MLIDRGLASASERFQTARELWTNAAEAIVSLKKQLLATATTPSEQLDIFWARLVQNNTNSLQPKTRIFEFYGPISVRDQLVVQYLQMNTAQKASVEKYLGLGVRLAEESRRSDDNCQLWRIQTSGGSLMYHEWIFGPEGVDLFRIVKTFDGLSPEDQQVIMDFLFISEELIARRSI